GPSMGRVNSPAASTAVPATPTQARYAPPRFSARGPISSALLDALGRGIREAGDSLGDLERLTREAIAASPDVIRDDDLQLSLLILHGLHYGAVAAPDDD